MNCAEFGPWQVDRRHFLPRKLVARFLGVKGREKACLLHLVQVQSLNLRKRGLTEAG